MKSQLLLLKVVVLISLAQCDGGGSILDRRNFRYRADSRKYQNYNNKDLNHFYKKGKERYYKYPTYYRYRS